MKKVREERDRLGLTQQEAADAIGISYSLYQKIEQGWRGCSDKNKVKIADFYKKSVGYLFFGEDITECDKSLS